MFAADSCGKAALTRLQKRAMQRHRAGRLAVLLSLNKIDSQPYGVERSTGYTKPVEPQVNSASPKRQQKAESTAAPGRTPSSVPLMQPSGSENSINIEEGSETSETSIVQHGDEMNHKRRTIKIIGAQADSGLGLSTGTARGDSALPLNVAASESNVPLEENEVDREREGRERQMNGRDHRSAAERCESARGRDEDYIG